MLLIFFKGKSFVWYFLLKFIREFPLNWSRTSSRKNYKRIPFNFDMGSFYKGFPWDFFFPRKSFVKFFWNFKLESDFFPPFLSKIRKLENCAHLFILNYNWANFEQDLRQFLFEKKSLCSSGILKKKSKFSPIFKLESDFFPHFLSKIS